MAIKDLASRIQASTFFCGQFYKLFTLVNYDCSKKASLFLKTLHGYMHTARKRGNLQLNLLGS
jgi:hypothetical protein